MFNPVNIWYFSNWNINTRLVIYVENCIKKVFQQVDKRQNNLEDRFGKIRGSFNYIPISPDVGKFACQNS